MSENKHTANELKMLQALPLDVKIQKTRLRIKEWVDAFGENGVYVSFSGGKDSTVLLDIVRKDYPNVEAVFVNTGLEYPSVRKFALSKESVTELRPKMNFREVLCKYGYPIIGKEISSKTEEVRKSILNGNLNTVRYRQFMGLEKKENGEPGEFNCERYKYLLDAPFKISGRCCDKMKKEPIHKMEKLTSKKPFIGQMAVESKQRKTKWIKNGCNAFELKNPQSNPMSFWTEQDVLTYIHENHLDIADAYGQVVVKGTESGQACINDMFGDYRGCEFTTTGCNRTGCVYCLFGCRQDLERIHRLQHQEPKIADYVLRGGGFDEKDGMWKPANGGLGYWFVLDWLALHGIVMSYDNAEHYRRTCGNNRTAELLQSQE